MLARAGVLGFVNASRALLKNLKRPEANNKAASPAPNGQTKTNIAAAVIRNPSMIIRFPTILIFGMIPLTLFRLVATSTCSQAVNQSFCEKLWQDDLSTELFIILCHKFSELYSSLKN
ncbi:hypothetical protein FBQ85_00670 [Cytophagia bacterium CHB2]|nr:hypothetical protein [Cytophagia bacterium CHB2]